MKKLLGLPSSVKCISPPPPPGGPIPVLEPLDPLGRGLESEESWELPDGGAAVVGAAVVGVSVVVVVVVQHSGSQSCFFAKGPPIMIYFDRSSSDENTH
jgi:hypothetical protein